MHAARLLDGLLFGKQDPAVQAENGRSWIDHIDYLCRIEALLKCGRPSADLGIDLWLAEREQNENNHLRVARASRHNTCDKFSE